MTEVTPHPLKTQGFHHFLSLLFYDHPAKVALCEDRAVHRRPQSGCGAHSLRRELFEGIGRLREGEGSFGRKRLENGKNLVNNCELFLHWGESPFIMGLSFELCRLRRGDARGGAGF